MSGDSPGPYLLVVLLVFVAAGLTTVEAALGAFSRARALELAQEGRPGAVKLLMLLDDPPRYLNAALFLRLLAETSAVVRGHRRGARPARPRRSGPRCWRRSG